MNPQTEQHARAILAGVNPKVGCIGILTVLEIVGFLMSFWSTCHQKSGSKENMQSRLRAECRTRKGREKNLKKIAHLVKHKSKVKLSKAKVKELAEASLNRALSVPAEEVKNYAAACGQLSDGEYAAAFNDSNDSEDV